MKPRDANQALTDELMTLTSILLQLLSIVNAINQTHPLKSNPHLFLLSSFQHPRTTLANPNPNSLLTFDWLLPPPSSSNTLLTLLPPPSSSNTNNPKSSATTTTRSLLLNYDHQPPLPLDYMETGSTTTTIFDLLFSYVLYSASFSLISLDLLLQSDLWCFWVVGGIFRFNLWCFWVVGGVFQFNLEFWLVVLVVWVAISRGGWGCRRFGLRFRFQMFGGGGGWVGGVCVAILRYGLGFRLGWGCIDSRYRLGWGCVGSDSEMFGDVAIVSALVVVISALVVVA